MSFIAGLLYGLTTVVFFGPVFFTILSATLQNGRRSGLTVTAGIVTSDICCLLICTYAASLVNLPSSQLWLSIAGSIVLLILGIIYIAKPIQFREIQMNLNASQYVGLFLKGFIVNFTSPFTFAYWFLAASVAKESHPGTISSAVFVGAAVLGILIIDIFKVLLSHIAYKIVQPKYMKWISRAVGLTMIGFSGFLVVRQILITTGVTIQTPL